MGGGGGGGGTGQNNYDYLFKSIIAFSIRLPQFHLFRSSRPPRQPPLHCHIYRSTPPLPLLLSSVNVLPPSLIVSIHVISSSSSIPFKFDHRFLPDHHHSIVMTGQYDHSIPTRLRPQDLAWTVSVHNQLNVVRYLPHPTLWL